MLQQEGNFTPPIQRSEFYQLSALKAVPNLIQNYSKLAPQKVTDKYKHAYMNCSAAQYGQGGADVAMLASNLREWYDKKVGKNTLDSSEGDQYANRIGRFLGSKYPEEDCDELIQSYRMLLLQVILQLPCGISSHSVIIRIKCNCRSCCPHAFIKVP